MVAAARSDKLHKLTAVNLYNLQPQMTTFTWYTCAHEGP